VLNLKNFIRTALGVAVLSGATMFSVMAHDLEVGGKNAREISAWVDHYAELALKAEPAAGVTILVAKGDDILFAKAYGYADLENKTASKVETVYQIGSLTKQFTSVAILQLEEQGKLSLNDDITKFLPDYPTQGKKITIANLLNHTSGIKNYIRVGYTDSKMAPGRLVNNGEYRLDLSHDEMTEFFKNEPLEFAPGTSWNYSNAGYYLAGMIIEKVSDLSYGEYIETHLMAPAEMTRSSYTNFEELVDNRARGYKIKDGKRLNANALSMSVPFSAGALSSTVTDLFKWTRRLHNGPQVLGKSAYKKLTTAGKLNNGKTLPMNYALGLATPLRDGHPVIMHPGGINGFSSIMSYFPEQDLSVIVLTNTYKKKSRAFADKVELALSAYLLNADITKFDFR
jgi:CubicO group peptidase (beta-lactamase class C family)